MFCIQMGSGQLNLALSRTLLAWQTLLSKTTYRETIGFPTSFPASITEHLFQYYAIKMGP